MSEEIKQCGKCNEKLNPGDKFCSSCGQSIEQVTKKKKQPFWAQCCGCLFFLFIVFFIGTVLSSTTKNIPNIYSNNDLELVKLYHCGDSYMKAACGIIHNKSSKTYSYVQVEINLYDQNNIQVGSTIANINNLEPYKKWDFKAPVFESRATRYEIKGITGF